MRCPSFRRGSNAAQLALTPQTEPGRPIGHVLKPATTGTAAQPDQVVNAYLYRPEFDATRKLWFADIILDGANAIWPFLRLSIARYQPNSIAGAYFSETVATDFVPLPPERITTVNRPDDESVRVTMSGVSAVTVTSGTDRVTRPRDDASLVAALAASRRVTVTLQARDATSTSDLEWTDVRSTACEITGADLSTFRATWSAALPLDSAARLQTPGAATDLRVLIEEFELLAADPRPGEQSNGTTERLIYADHLPL